MRQEESKSRGVRRWSASVAARPLDRISGARGGKESCRALPEVRNIPEDFRTVMCF